MFVLCRSFKTVCYKRCGCVTNDRFFMDAPMFESIKSDDITFDLYTPEKPNDPIRTSLSFLPDDFKSNRPTKLFLHGWKSSPETFTSTKDKIFQSKKQVNVFLVNWTSISNLLYCKSVTNLQLVGHCVAYYLRRLIYKYGGSSMDYHCIGHSLGAHACGYIGQKFKRFNMILGRATGLDPAGPCFKYTRNSKRLDKSDALFQDNIHTSTKGFDKVLGISMPLGHVDFFPNYREEQPPCEYVSKSILSAKSCAHSIAKDYFVASLERECSFIAEPCHVVGTKSVIDRFIIHLYGNCGHSCQMNTTCQKMVIMKYFAALLLLPFAFCAEVCYPPCGCFNDDPPFEGDWLPEPIEEQDITYELFTRNNRDDPIDCTLDQLPNEFDQNKPTKFVWHGWNGRSASHYATKDAILDHVDANVFVVDWPGATDLVYFQAVANARLAGSCTGVFTKRLLDRFGGDIDTYHCVGHSLGAHVCGYYGDMMNYTYSLVLGRATGLDPAGPGFDGGDPRFRLDKEDARFQDNIHTNTKGFIYLGLGKPVGDVDFFPNKGDFQPPCEDGSCSDHSVCVRYFRISMDKDQCQYTAYPCNSDDDADDGKCETCTAGVDCQRMGYYADTMPGYEGPLNIEDVNIALENDEFQLYDLVKNLSEDNIVTNEELLQQADQQITPVQVEENIDSITLKIEENAFELEKERVARRKKSESEEEAQTCPNKCEAEYERALKSSTEACKKVDNALSNVQIGVRQLASIGENMFFSNMPFDQHKEAEKIFTQQLTQFTKRQFIQGIEELAVKKNDTQFEFLDVTKPEILLLKGYCEEVNIAQCRQLARLKKLFFEKEKKYFNALLLEASLSAANQFLDTVEISKFSKNISALEKQINENKSKSRRIENDILNLTTNSLPMLLQHAQEAQETRILRGDYDLKIMRQNYFLDKQDQVIEELAKQRARWDILLVASDIEVQRHRETKHLLTAISSFLSDFQTCIESRSKVLEAICAIENYDTRTTVHSKDATSLMLGQILTEVQVLSTEKSHSKKLFYPFSFINERAQVLTEKYKNNQISNFKRNEDVINKIKELENLCKELNDNSVLNMFENLYSQYFHNLSTSLQSCEVKAKTLLKDIETKKKELGSNQYKALENDLCILFYTDRMNFLNRTQLFCESE
ncbi:DgyrCDS7239 [Dimorphilus gyrociliatus]|uniref:DgyrCDS7239 n=1 Tax=Dimorphilus gyrociliatus TaxID=2664684 RepID=A0A7I8VRE5_9ANNE|nr:DgyrCDS7239 [Dimorphilus gyrociliatus]